MKILHTSLMALMGFAFAATAHAGTTLPPSVVETTTPGSFYLSLAGGALWQEDASASGVSLDFDTGYSVLGAIGYKIDYGLAIELESGYMEADLGNASFRGLHANVDGEFEQVPIMVNAIFWVPMSDRLSLYVGAGSGIVWSKTTVDSVAGVNVSGVEDSDWNFAAQAKAGLSFKVCPQGSLNVGYRFFYGKDGVGGLDDSLGHVLEGGFTWWF